MQEKNPRRKVNAAAANAQPHLVWNAFVDLLAMEHYEDLTPLQRQAHLAFWYESEVQNGGHGQYFENRGTEHLGATCKALMELGLEDHAALLGRALKVVAAQPPGTAWERLFHDGAIEELDKDFHKCQPTIIQALERHLAAHTDAYVEHS